jgi:hypothetical protein
MTLREVEHAVSQRPNAAAIMEEFMSLGSVRKDESGTWVLAGEAA